MGFSFPGGGWFILNRNVAEAGADKPTQEERMNKDPAIEAFYTTWAWRKCRDSFLTSKGRLCEICLKKGLIEPAVHVHHKTSITPENVKDPEITLNHNNLMALCEKCHTEQHRKKRWRCEPDGHVHI